MIFIAPTSGQDRAAFDAASPEGRKVDARSKSFGQGYGKLVNQN